MTTAPSLLSEPRLRQHWDPIAATHPKLVAGAHRYLAQIEISSRPNTVSKVDEVLRGFCQHLVASHPEVEGFGDVGRDHIEAFKVALLARRTTQGTPLKPNTLRAHLGLLRAFFDRIVEWGWEDAPDRVPIYSSDMPRIPRPLPKALDDPTMARFLSAAAHDSDRRRQLCVELLARTGMRVSELCALRADAMSCRSGSWWLQVPVGKLHNDRYVPLHPRLVKLIEDWQAFHDDHGTGLLLTVAGVPIERHAVARMVRKVARDAGVGHVHPHQLRHTLATQAINRGMRLEAVAELLGHKSLTMTLAYARIANRVVADQFQAVSDKVDALYVDPTPDEETPAMKHLRLEYRRLLANGWCTRPKALDCHFESICEGCGYFETGVEFLPVLKRQRDHALEHDQRSRHELFERLVSRAEGAS